MNNLFYSLLPTFFLNLLLVPILIIVIKKKFFLDYSHEGPQKIHNQPTARIGGIIIYSLLLINTLIFYKLNDDITKIVIIFILIAIVSIREDIFSNTYPLTRLIFIFFASGILLYISDLNIKFEIFILENFLNIKLIQIIFFILLISTVVNGFNIIDGSNGHCTLISISTILIISFLAAKNFEIDFLKSFIPIIFLAIFFLFFNFPKGLIFLGDTGAYLFGWYLSCSLLILLENLDNSLSEIIFLNILFYPIFETIFSFIRKIFLRKSPFKPDSLHLHLMMIDYLKNQKKLNNFNYLTTIYLMPIWITPLFILPIIYKNNHYLIAFLIIQVVVYISFYILLKKLRNIKI
tara:strand:+ start:2837 stop:3883 length:1047 start_codon:yes stop_codon:yes gene_type:complete